MARARLLLAAALLAASIAAPLNAEPGPEPDGTTPTDPRDFSGVWMNDNTLDERLRREGRTRLAPGESPGPRRAVPMLTPAYEQVRAERLAARAHLAEGAEPCAWPGMPQIMTYPYPLEILHTPGRITLVFEAESQVRRIFLDRAEHLPFDELDPSYNGDSIGHWDGDVLVVDTVGFHEHTQIPGGYPHSADMRIVERIRYIDGDTIEVAMTITDPAAMVEPFAQTIIYSQRPDWRIREYSCLENNRDAPDASGQRVGGVVPQ